MVKRVSKGGLAARVLQKCDADRRGAFVLITSRGRRELSAAAPKHVEAVRDLFVDLLQPEQLAVIRDVAHSVLAQLSIDAETLPRIDDPA